MDRKAILVVSSSIAFIILWTFVITPKYFTKDLPPRPTNVVAAASAAAPVATTPAPVPTMTAGGSVAQPAAFVTPTAAEETVVLTHQDVRYTFTSHGGGIKNIELLRYPQSTAFGRKADTNRIATLNTRAPVPIMSVLGEPALVGDGHFDLTQTDKGVRAEKRFPNGLVMVKEFRPTSNYQFSVSVRVENRSASNLVVGAQEWVIGTTTPMNALDKDPATRGVMWSDGKSTHDTVMTWFENKGFFSCFTGSSNPRTEYRGGASNIVWAAPHNQFFTIAAVPPTNAAVELVARTITLPKPSLEELPPDAPAPVAPVGIQSALVFPGLALPAGASHELTLKFFTGPKEYRTLANIAAEHGNNLDALMNFGFFGFFSKLLLLSMNWIHDMLSVGYGWAIVIITIIIKLLFWPLTAASTRSMKRMAALQPQMKALQEKYKDDPAKLNRKMMEFWKEHKVSPLGGCLPMLLQIPVFFGFFMMIRSAIELRGASFLWVTDLSQPDTLFHLAGFPVNLLPLLMGATMLWQARLTPPSPGMDPTQQKIMKYMPLMFMVFLYGYSAALTLYWTTQNLLTILQTKLTKTEPEKTAPAAPAAKSVAPKRK
jgi:YidC/Oxa1 family membrane protein insertase